MFGLPANFDTKNVILNGEDPGITTQDEEGEADLDVEWSGAVAPGATVKFVVSASTPASQGIDLSALYIVEHNLARQMSESYGICESGLGSAGNAFYNSLWQQAAAQGITAMVSAGDNGSAGCDDFNNATTASYGLAVNGLAWTPYNVAVGGTDFDQVNNWTLYWNSTNDTSGTTATGTSAKAYIPEIPWNQSCAQIGLTGCGASAPGGSMNIVAGSGGPSNTNGKPTWQLSVTGMLNDSHRDLPDVSLFASSGFDGSGYLYCQEDLGDSSPCTLNTGAGIVNLQVVGGTSASSPAFAGAMALVNQYQAAHGGTGRQGNASYVLYSLVKKAGASCTSSATEAATCIFNDVTKGNSVLPNGGVGVGTNSVPCTGGTPNCSASVASATGVLVDPAHPTVEAWAVGAGYDLATGLGSVNVSNLATQWKTVNRVATTTTLALSKTTGITHGTGENVAVNITVTPTSATGSVSLIAKLADGTTQGLDQFTLASGKVVNGTTSSLPGGTYTVTAHYAGEWHERAERFGGGECDGGARKQQGVYQSNLTITAGQSANLTLTVTPVTNINGSLQLQIPSPMQGITCNVNPAQIPLSGTNAVTATLTCSVPAPSASNSTGQIVPKAWPQLGSRNTWWKLGGLLGALALAFWILPVHLRLRRLGYASLVLSSLSFAVGCGGGGGGGTGGSTGGGGSLAPTSTTISVANTKVPSGANLMATVQVSGANSPTGQMTLGVVGLSYSVTTGTLVNGQAQFSYYLGSAGGYEMSAGYGGDSKNLPSQTQTPLAVVQTGAAGPLTVNASTGPTTKQINVTLTVQ